MTFQNLAAPLDIHGRMRPRHPAIITDDGVLDWATFALRVRQMAEALQRDGITTGSLVGVSLKDTHWHLAALFAVIRLGAVIVPFDWRWTESETASLAQHFAIDAMLQEGDGPRIAGTTRIAADEDWLSALLRRQGTAPLIDAADLPMVLSLSSGTTGRPTGPMLTHAQMRARSENQLATLTFSQHDRYLLSTPLYFGGGRAFTLTHLMIGATVILKPPPCPPREYVAAVARHGATSAFLVPTQIRRLLELPDSELAGLRGLRVLISSGAPLHPPERTAIARRISRGFFEYFASTEGGGISVLPPQDTEAHGETVGRAAYMVDVEVVGENHASLPAGEVGLIRYRGPGVAEGFYRDPEKSAEAFRDGWFYPGDLGCMDAEGFLTLMGRAKNVIIRGGVNIYPSEIERVLQAHPSIPEASVFGLADAEMGEVVCAALAGPALPKETDILDHCRARLARYKLPSRFLRLGELPRNAGGKVLTDGLKQMLEQDAPSGEDA